MTQEYQVSLNGEPAISYPTSQQALDTAYAYEDECRRHGRDYAWKIFTPRGDTYCSGSIETLSKLGWL